jgi:hypothetical protein
MIQRLIFAAWILIAASAGSAAEARIIKVLPHLLDAKGRTALQPSLFERDAYQIFLREHPDAVSGLRFDVQFKSKPKNLPLTLKLELRGSKTELGKTRLLEIETRATGWFSTWAHILLNRETTDEVGKIIAWRASLWNGSEMLAEQQSFLW